MFKVPEQEKAGCETERVCLAKRACVARQFHAQGVSEMTGRKVYRAVRDSARGVTCLVITEHGSGVLPPCNTIVNHSPDGFEFGYGGSGPAQLALALCVDVLGDVQRALRVYQDFKRAYIAPVDGNELSFTDDQVRAYINEIEVSRAQR